MHRVLLTLPWFGRGFEVSSYRAAFMVAAVVAVTIAWYIATRRGMSPRDALVVFVATAIALPVGARLWHIVTNPSVYSKDPSQIWNLNPTGFAMFGGIAGAAIAGLVAARLRHVDVWRLADAAAPALGVGIAIMRIGCFANGCCFGLPTDGPLGVVFPPGSYSHLWEMAHGYVGLFDAPRPVHPTQLYEAVGALACAAVAAVLIARRAPDGVAFSVFVGGFAIVRYANWTLRVHPDTLTDPAIYWPIYAATVAVCAGLAVWRWRVGRQSDGAGTNRT